jgi:DNA helicase-2/ATP-dependent DNA helicase PcrA
MIRYFQSMLTGTNAYDVAVQVGKHTNLVKELFNDKTTEGLARYENIQELLNSIKEWTESPGNDDGELGDNWARTCSRLPYSPMPMMTKANRMP